MTKYIAILRGINVGGHRKIKMADLKAMMSEEGYTSIETYIQSGNVSFETENEDIKSIEDNLSKAIASTFNFDVPVIVLSKAELNDVFSQNPFINSESPLEYLYVTVLKSPPEKADIDMLKAVNFDNESLVVVDRWVYLCVSKSYHKCKLNNQFFEKKLKIATTTRNWKTITKLNDMLAD